MKRNAVIIGIAALAVLLIAGVLFKNKNKIEEKKQPVDRSHIAVPVLFERAGLRQISNEISIPATLIANDEGIISAEVSGRLQSLSVELGTSVVKGQVIGQIDVSETRVKLKASELAVEKLGRDYERSKVLLAGNATNANAVSDTKFDLDSKKLEADQLRSQISKSKITAPITGTVTGKKMVKGEFAAAGAEIASVVDIRNLKVKVYLPESQIQHIEKGMQGKITSESLPGEIFRGRIIYVSPKGDDNHNYLLELLLDNSSNSKALKAGLYVQVNFENKKVASTLQIPKTSLVEGIKKPYVYVMENGRARERKLTLGRQNGEYIEVINGITAGEQVVTSGLINVTEGSYLKSIKN